MKVNNYYRVNFRNRFTEDENDVYVMSSNSDDARKLLEHMGFVVLNVKLLKRDLENEG